MKFKRLLRGMMCGLLFSASLSHGQTNMTLRDQLDQHGSGYANIWGYVDSLGNEYALLGCYTGTAIINVANPDTAVEVDFIPGASSSWHEIQVWGKYAYVVSEGGGGVQIIYLGNLPDTAYLAATFTTTIDRAHDLQIRDGYCYVTGSQTPTPNDGIHILDLSDPEAPVEVGAWDSLYVHDCYVRQDTVYAACIFDGVVAIIDVRSKANPYVVYAYDYPNSFTHNTALSDDGRYLFTTDETSGPPGRLRRWDLITLKDGIEGNTNIEETANYGGTAIVHNVYAIGNFAYASYYTEGVRAWHITDPDTLIVAGHYDTYPSGNGASFTGAWGVYPFLGSGNLIVSDMVGGLFVVTFDIAQKGQLAVTVRDSAGQHPLQGAKVTSIETNLSRVSNSDGVVSMPMLAGRHTLRVDYPNVPATYVTVEVLDSVITSVNVDLEDVVVGVEGPGGRPASFRLHQNYPNPFNPSTTLRYELSSPAAVSLIVYNTLGQEVRTLVDASQPGGVHTVVWDGKDRTGNSVSSGVYIYRLRVGSRQEFRKMLLMK